MTGGVVHLVVEGEAQHDPCSRCGRRLESMNVRDSFTMDPTEATCEVRS